MRKQDWKEENKNHIYFYCYKKIRNEQNSVGSQRKSKQLDQEKGGKWENGDKAKDENTTDWKEERK